MTDLLSPLTLSQWLANVGSMTLAAGAVLLVVTLLDFALARRVSARARLVLYVAVFARLALPLDWASPLGLFGDRTSLPATLTETTLTASDQALDLPAAPATIPAVPAPTGFLLHASIAAFLALTWALVHRREITSLLRGAKPARQRVRVLAGDLPVVEHESRGPAVFGLLHPRIALPSPLIERLDDDALRAVLAHEGAHLKRRDPLLLALLRLATFLAWPILPAWLASWRMRGLMEQACDEMALAGASVASRRSYGEALLAVASWQPRPARLGLGMLAFGGGLAPRLRALRHSTRWPRAIQAALALSSCALIVLASGERGLRADMSPASERTFGTPDGFPPLVVFEMRVFTDVTDVPPRGSLRVLNKDDANGRLVAVGPTSELLQSFAPDGEGGSAGTTRAWLGGSMINSLKIKHSAATSDAPAGQVVYQLAPRIDDGGLVAVIGWPLPAMQFLAVPAPLAEGESVLILRTSAPFVAILLTPSNVSWSDGSPRVSSPRVTLDLHDVGLDDALKAVMEQAGVPVKAERSPMLSEVSLVDMPLENALAGLAADAGLVPRMENGMLKLVAPVAPPSEIERRVRALGPPELRILAVREEPEAVVLHARLPASATPAFLKALDLDFKPREINMTKPAGDPGSGREGDVELLVKLDPLSTAPRRIVACSLEAYRMKASDLASWLAGSGLAADAGGGCLGPSKEQYSALLRALRQPVEDGRAVLLTSPRILVRLEEEASVSTSGPDTRVDVAVKPHLTSDGLVLDVRASVGGGPEGRQRCGGAAPAILVLPGEPGQVSVFLIEADLKDAPLKDAP